MAERELFSPLLDTVDGVLVCSARCSPAEVREQLSGSNLRFPLSLDSHTPLAIQLAASSHAAGSSRFGPWCDNILGMNWRLPDGRIVRLGERVVKSTTGYDLLRFFLASAGRFGEPVDLVLRLRPDTGCTTIFWCTAAQSWVLTKLAATLLHSGWLHWCDVIDLHYAPREDAPSEHAPSEGAAAANASSDIGRTMYAPNIESRLCVSLHAPPDEANLFARFLKAYAEKEEIAISTTANEPVPLAGLPDFVLKTTPDLVGPWASAIASRWPVRCVALCYPGVVHGYGNPGADAALIAGEVEAHFASAVAQLGGEFHSRLLPQRPLQSPEREWITSLECGMGWGIR
jgi:FAD/FMN-containing dehydrogenase